MRFPGQCFVQLPIGSGGVGISGERCGLELGEGVAISESFRVKYGSSLGVGPEVQVHVTLMSRHCHLRGQ